MTTIQDDYLDPAPGAFDAAARAYHDMGLRCVMTVSFLDIPFADGRPFLGELLPPELLHELHASPPPTVEEQVDTFEQHRSVWHHPDQRSSVILAPIAPQRCSESLLTEIARISEEQNVAVHCHVDETRLQAVTARRFFDCSLTEYLERAGLLTERLTLNHAIWLSDRDIELLGERGCSITHNPLSNLKLGSGVCPVQRLLRAGVNVALGTDGTSTSDTVDIVEALRVASVLHTLSGGDYEQWLGPTDAFRMMTRGGAVSTRLSHQIGSIEKGKKADIVLLDRQHPGFVPLHDPVRQLGLSVNSEAVRTVVIDGRVVMRDRSLSLIDEAALKAEIGEVAEHYRENEWPKRQEAANRVMPYIRAMYARGRTHSLDLGSTRATLERHSIPGPPINDLP